MMRLDNEIGSSFLDCSARLLDRYSGRIANCLEKLSYQQVWARGTENENAVGNLLLHLNGNLGQWIASGLGGKPDVRQRSAEFAARGDLQPGELRGRLAKTVEDAASTIRAFPPERLLEKVTIQGYELSFLEAIYHVVEHFAQHTGQIIFATKQFTGEDLGFYRHLSRPAPQGEKAP
jgi:uncharacterized damage-inducible protein DinB